MKLKQTVVKEKKEKKKINMGSEGRNRVRQTLENAALFSSLRRPDNIFNI